MRETLALLRAEEPSYHWPMADPGDVPGHKIKDYKIKSFNKAMALYGTVKQNIANKNNDNNYRTAGTHLPGKTKCLLLFLKLKRKKIL